MRSMGPLLGVTGIAGVALGLKSAATSAMDFQSAMEMLRTQTGATQAEVDTMSASVLTLAKSLPQGPNELAAGLYHVESAGYRGAKALDILTIAAKGAATGGADLESVTNAIVGAEQSGVKGAENLGMAMGTLNAIVGAGNMRMQDLADAFGTGILATAKTFGVSMQSVGAAIATMTDEGVPAIDAATRLRMSINLLGAPTSRAAKELGTIGIKQLDLANAMRSPGGITAAMELLRGSMVKAKLIDAQGNVNSEGAQLLSRAFGGGRSSAAIMTLVGNMGLLEQKTAAVNKGATGFNDAWAAAADTAKVKWDTFMSTLQVVGIQVGNALLPTITDAAKALGDWVDKHSDDIVNFFKGAVGAARTLGSVIGTAFGALSKAWDAIPEGLRGLLVGGFAVQKTSSWLFGSGPLQWLTKLAGVGAAKVTGIGALAGIGVQHVWVDNMGMGGMGGGAPGAVAAGGGKIGMVGGLLGYVGIASITVAAGQAIADAIGATPQNPVSGASRAYYRNGGNENGPSGTAPKMPPVPLWNTGHAAQETLTPYQLKVANADVKRAADKTADNVREGTRLTNQGLNQTTSAVAYAKIAQVNAVNTSSREITDAVWAVQRAVLSLGSISVQVTSANVTNAQARRSAVSPNMTMNSHGQIIG